MTTQLLTTPSAADASALAAAIGPDSPDYDSARASFNLAVDQHPAAIAYPSTAADVIECVRGARATGLKVAVQSGSHNAGPQGDLRDALLIRTSEMNRVTIDTTRRLNPGLRSYSQWLEQNAERIPIG